ncbi:MAG: hypothetical protein AAFS10_18790 [Myxococcota bacterium]
MHQALGAAVCTFLAVCVAQPCLANPNTRSGQAQDPSHRIEPIAVRLAFPLPAYEPQLGALPDVGEFRLRTWSTSDSGKGAWNALAQRVAMRVMATWEIVEYNVDFTHLYGQSVVQVNVPGTREVVHVGPDVAWYNVLSKLPLMYHPGERYHMGPYIQNWKSVGPGFEGHYGVRLKVAW